MDKIFNDKTSLGKVATAISCVYIVAVIIITEWQFIFGLDNLLKMINAALKIGSVSNVVSMVAVVILEQINLILLIMWLVYIIRFGDRRLSENISKIPILVTIFYLVAVVLRHLFYVILNNDYTDKLKGFILVNYYTVILLVAWILLLVLNKKRYIAFSIIRLIAAALSLISRFYTFSHFIKNISLYTPGDIAIYFIYALLALLQVFVIVMLVIYFVKPELLFRRGGFYEEN